MPSGFRELVQPFPADIADRRARLCGFPFDGQHRSVLAAVQHIESVYRSAAFKSLGHRISAFDPALAVGNGRCLVQPESLCGNFLPGSTVPASAGLCIMALSLSSLRFPGSRFPLRLLYLSGFLLCFLSVQFRLFLFHSLSFRLFHPETPG